MICYGRGCGWYYWAERWGNLKKKNSVRRDLIVAVVLMCDVNTKCVDVRFCRMFDVVYVSQYFLAVECQGGVVGEEK